MKFVKRDYWDANGTHRPYRNRCHEFVDGEEGPSADPLNLEPKKERAFVPNALEALPDGTVFRVEIIPTGEQAPGHYQLTEPHKYSRVDRVKQRKLKRD